MTDRYIKIYLRICNIRYKNDMFLKFNDIKIKIFYNNI